MVQAGVDPQYGDMQSAFDLEILSQEHMRDRLKEADRERLACELRAARHRIPSRSVSPMLAWLGQAVYTVAEWLEPTPLQQQLVEECPAFLELTR